MLGREGAQCRAPHLCHWRGRPFQRSSRLAATELCTCRVCWRARRGWPPPLSGACSHYLLFGTIYSSLIIKGSPTPPIRSPACAQGTTSAGHLAPRRAGGGRDASWRMRVAAVTCCEADDRVVHSAALRAATPRPRRPTTTRRRPTAVSTGARRRHNGASVSRIAYRVSPRDPACAGGAPRATARALTENAACACGVRSIGRVDTTGCASSAGPTTAGVQLIRCVNRALRNSGTSPDVSRRREADTDYRDAPHPPPP